jgi:hypothetical protein
MFVFDFFEYFLTVHVCLAIKDCHIFYSAEKGALGIHVCKNVCLPLLLFLHIQKRLNSFILNTVV